MDRLTRIRDKYECRIAKGCKAEAWMKSIYGRYPEDVCCNCPFEKIVNKLAEYEDKEEKNSMYRAVESEE